MKGKIQIVSRKHIYKASYFTVEEQEVELPNKKRKTYASVDRDPSVVVLPLVETNELYCVSQYRYQQKKTTLELIAGYVDKGEDFLTAAKRELKEEGGIVAKKWRLLGVTELSGSVILSSVVFFLAEDLTIGDTKFDEDEDITLKKMQLSDLVSKALSLEINDMGSMLGILLLRTLQLENKI